jgi:hypothetical protein
MSLSTSKEPGSREAKHTDLAIDMATELVYKQSTRVTVERGALAVQRL